VQPVLIRGLALRAQPLVSPGVESARDRDADAPLRLGCPAYQPIDLGVEQVCLADEARPNDDPFDALICAAARALGLPLVTRDLAPQEWGKVPTVW
jgi:hypothetical protein